MEQNATAPPENESGRVRGGPSEQEQGVSIEMIGQVDVRVNPLLAALGPIVDRVVRRYHWRKRRDRNDCIKRPLTDEILAAHVGGKDACGAALIEPGTSATRIALLDLDSHKGETSWAEMVETAARLIAEMRRRGLCPYAFRSSGGKGIHLYALWEAPQDAYSVRALLFDVLAACGLQGGTGGVIAGEVEVFPKQDAVAADRFGSMFVLPLAGRSVPLADDLAPLTKADALAIEWLNSTPVPVVERVVRERPAASVEHPDLRVLQSALAAIPNSAGNSLEYDAFRNVAFGVHHATDGSSEGHDLLHAFAKKSEKYDADFIDERLWPYIRSDRQKAVTAGTIFRLARDHGWTEPTESVAAEFEDLVEAERAAAHTEVDTLELVGGSADAAIAAIRAAQLARSETQALIDRVGKATGEPLEALHKRLTQSRNIVPYSEFCTNIAPPVYVWHRVLQKGNLYAITAKWGHGKTALKVTVTLHVAAGLELGGHEIAQGKVLYLCGENPADVQLRATAAARYFEIAPDVLADRVYFTRRPFAIDDPKALAAFLKDAVEFGPFDLLVIDTGPAHSAAEEENDNREMHNLAMRIRDLMGPLGNPATVVLMHPVKDASRDNLQPRGGGAFSGSIDGELAAWKDENNLVEFFHRPKFRGPGFKPIMFRLEKYTLPGIFDNFGASVETVLAVPTSASPSARTQKGRELTNADKLALQALESALSDPQLAAQPDAALSVQIESQFGAVPKLAVRGQDWRQRAYDLDVSDRKDEAKRKAFNRASEKLAAQRRVGSLHGFVWVTE